MKNLSLALIMAILATTISGPCFAQAQVKISGLPTPLSGSVYLTAGDIVPATRNNNTYGLRANFGSACASNQWISSLSPQGYGTCTQPSFSSISGSLTAAQMPAFTGDFTTIAGSVNATLKTVNSNVGTFGSATQIPQFTVNAKGLVTAVGNTPIAPAWSSITGTPTNISGYGITDALSNVATITAAGPVGSSSIVPVITYNATGQLTSVTTATITPSAIGAPTTTGTGASGTWGISISGTSASAGSLSPGATINGVSFTGASNITVPAAASTLTGSSLASNVTSAPGLVVALDTQTSGVLPVAKGGNGCSGGEIISSGSSSTADLSKCTTVWNSSTAAPKAESIAGCTSSNAWLKHSFKDAKGTALLYPITITPSSGTIEGASSLKIQGVNQTLTLECDGVSNWMVK